MYRPNFCNECGTRLDCARRRMWGSARFCGNCARRLRQVGVAAPLMAGIVLVVGGYLAGRAGREHPPPLVIERAASRGVAAPLSAAAQQNENASEAPGGPSPESGEAVSMCGARTQKGKPCSRRVRGAGRCWQHKGKLAMLPSAKLIVQE